MTDGMTIFQASSPEHMDTVRELFREYQQWLNEDTCFQDFDRELNALPGEYAPPSGRLYLACDNTLNKVAGCVALRSMGNGKCEMKRLYIRDFWRGKGLGRKLAELLLADAKMDGHSHMCLETFDKLTAAIALYTSLGFVQITSADRISSLNICYMEAKLS